MAAIMAVIIPPATTTPAATATMMGGTTSIAHTLTNETEGSTGSHISQTTRQLLTGFTEQHWIFSLD